MSARTWTLRQRVTALCVVVGAVLAMLATGAAVVAAQNRTQLDTLLNKTGPVRTGAEKLLGALVDQQTGMRGYAVTGRDADLEPYRAGIEQERQLIASMEPLLGDHPKIYRQLQSVRQQAEQWRATTAEPVIETTRRSGISAGQALLTAQDSGQRFDELRSSVEKLQQMILDLGNEGADATLRSSKTLVVLLIIAGMVVLLAGSALVLSLNRAVIGPLTTLAAQVRGLAEGNYHRNIEKVGPPELAQLAGDVDAVRRKIASDLAEVQAARTSIEEANRQLEKQAEELVRSNRDLEQFAYVASHDLQEPLRKVASFCQLLQRRYAGQLDERADQYIAFAVDGAQRMQRLINDLLAFSRIGRLTTGFAEVDLDRVMGDVAGQTEAARQYADGELTWSDLPVINGEEALLTNLLANLVSNSFKFRRPNVPPRVHISARRLDDEWEITCQDNGIGIESEFADKIFVIFQRLHSKDAYPGTGIGLAIVKKIVEYHGGRIWVDPEVTEGTVIRFTLPALAVQESEEPTESAPDGAPVDGSGEIEDTAGDQAPHDAPAEAAPADGNGGDPAAGGNGTAEAAPADGNGGDPAAGGNGTAEAAPADGNGGDPAAGGGTADGDPGGAPAEETGGMRETVA